jgi:hypothetical protein
MGQFYRLNSVEGLTYFKQLRFEINSLRLNLEDIIFAILIIFLVNFGF